MSLQKLSRAYGTQYAGLSAVLRDAAGTPARMYGLQTGEIPTQNGAITLDASGGFSTFVDDSRTYKLDIYGPAGSSILTDFGIEAGESGAFDTLSASQKLAKASSVVRHTLSGEVWLSDRPLAVTDLGFQPSNTLYSCGVPVGLPPSGSVGDNGALTLGTATTIAYTSGIYWYFSAGQLYSGSLPGFYFTLMSTVTSGVVYGNLYTPVSNLPSVPSSPTPITATGSGAYSGQTSAVAAVTRTVPANFLGKNGKLEAHLIGSHTNSAGNKIYILNFGGIQVYSTAATTSQSYTLPRYVTQNRGSELVQVSSNAAVTSMSSAAVLQTAINTTLDQPYQVLLQKSVSTDFMVIESCTLIADRGLL